MFNREQMQMYIDAYMAAMGLNPDPLDPLNYIEFGSTPKQREIEPGSLRSLDSIPSSLEEWCRDA